MGHLIKFIPPTDAPASIEETLEQLKAKLRAVWVRGRQWRLEVGHLLLHLRRLAPYGQWGPMLAELGIKDSTAWDYMAEAFEEITGSRVFPQPTDEDDPEAQQMRLAVTEAQAAVDTIGRPPRATRSSHRNRHKVELADHVKLRGPVLYCSADQKDRYAEERAANPDRVYRIFHQALMEVIHQEEADDEALAA